MSRKIKYKIGENPPHSSGASPARRRTLMITDEILNRDFGRVISSHRIHRAIEVGIERMGRKWNLEI